VVKYLIRFSYQVGITGDSDEVPWARQPSLPSLPGRIPGKEQTIDGQPVEEMGLEDFLEVSFLDSAVPDILGIHGGRDSQAAMLEAAGSGDQDSLLQSVLANEILHHSDELLSAFFSA
jgi:hypothetical protein